MYNHIDIERDHICCTLLCGVYGVCLYAIFNVLCRSQSQKDSSIFFCRLYVISFFPVLLLLLLLLLQSLLVFTTFFIHRFLVSTNVCSMYAHTIFYIASFFLNLLTRKWFDHFAGLSISLFENHPNIFGMRCPDFCHFEIHLHSMR